MNSDQSYRSAVSNGIAGHAGYTDSQGATHAFYLSSERMSDGQEADAQIFHNLGKRRQE